MAKGYRINGKSIAKTGLVVGLLTGLYWGGSALFGWLSDLIDAIAEQNSQRQAVAEENATYQGTTQIKINGVDYTIENASTIVVRNGSSTTYRYDFQNAAVIIDGPDDADRVVLFSEYDDQSIINNVRQIGCDLSADIVTSLDAFNESIGRPHHTAEIHGPLASSFLNNNCPVTRPN